MKTLWNTLVLVLALNFVAAAGAAGWLYQTGRLDRGRIMAMRDILFPPPPPSAPASATQPAEEVPSGGKRLEELLARHAGLPAGQQVELIQQTYDAQMAQLDQRERSLRDLQALVSSANAKLASDRRQLEQDSQNLEDRRRQAQAQAADQGFQDSLNLYSSMPAKQVKSVFMTLDDAAVVQYLRALPPRTAGKIIKEFKTPEELDRIQRILEKIRQSQPTTKETKEP